MRASEIERLRVDNDYLQAALREAENHVQRLLAEVERLRSVRSCRCVEAWRVGTAYDVPDAGGRR